MGNTFSGQPSSIWFTSNLKKISLTWQYPLGRIVDFCSLFSSAFSLGVYLCPTARGHPTPSRCYCVLLVLLGNLKKHWKLTQRCAAAEMTAGIRQPNTNMFGATFNRLYNNNETSTDNTFLWPKPWNPNTVLSLTFSFSLVTLHTIKHSIRIRDVPND